MGDAFWLGTGFSRAICLKMPTMMEQFKALGPLVGEVDDFSREANDHAAGNVETLLSYHAIPSPCDDHICKKADRSYQKRFQRSSSPETI